MAAADADPEIELRLPLSSVQTLVQHLYLGLYVGNPVHNIVQAIIAQANPQIILAAADVLPRAAGTADESAAPSPKAPERLN